jgi:hypothetical protein
MGKEFGVVGGCEHSVVAFIPYRGVELKNIVSFGLASRLEGLRRRPAASSEQST